jgi:hypothetical protein
VEASSSQEHRPFIPATRHTLAEVTTRASAAVGDAFEACFADTSALAVECYRVLGGLALAGWFFGQAATAVEVSRRIGVQPSAAGQASALLLAWVQACDPRWYCVLCGVLALAVAAGHAARFWSACLVAAFAGWVRRWAPVMCFDDVIVGLASLWLSLLPIGRALRVGDAIRRRAELSRVAALRVPGGAARFYRCVIVLVYANTSFWAHAWLGYRLSVGMRVLSAALVALLLLPRELGLRRVAWLLQACLHAWLCASTGHGIFVSCVLLSAGVLFVAPSGSRPREAAARADAGALLGALYLLVCALFAVASFARVASLRDSAGELLSDVGTPPAFLELRAGNVPWPSSPACRSANGSLEPRLCVLSPKR